MSMSRGKGRDFTSDFSDFKDMGLSKTKRADSVSSSTSTSSNLDSDQRDLVYAQYYFMDTDTRDHHVLTTTISSSSPSTDSEVEFIVISDAKDKSSDDDVIIVSSPATTPTATPSSNRSTKSAEKKANKKRKKKKWELFKERKKSKITKNYYDESQPMMELDSDFEDGNESIPSDKIVTSDRQANIQARVPDKMDPNDKWFLVEKDLLGREQYEKLYEFNRYSLKQLKCYNCKQKGHRPSECPQSKRHTICYLCGIADHVSSRCPDNICQYCFQPSHRGRPCKSTQSNPRNSCRRCFVKGHNEVMCPEQWRQFHNTTHSSDRLYQYVIRQGDRDRSTPVYCSNCASEGHYGFECHVTRPRGYPHSFVPLVVRYDEQLYHELQVKPSSPHLTSSDDNHSKDSIRPKDASKSKKKRRRRKREREDRPEEQSVKQGKWDHHEEPPPPHTRHTQATKGERRDSNNLPHQYNEPSSMRHTMNEESLIHSTKGPPSRSRPLFTSPPPLMSSPPRAYHGSIHDRLDPLPVRDSILTPTPTHRQLRSLSFEHNRIPDEFFEFNSSLAQPRWGQSPVQHSYPRSPFPSTSTPILSPPVDDTHLNNYPNHRPSSYSDDKDHYGPGSYSRGSGRDRYDHTPSHRPPPILSRPPPLRRPSPPKRRWSGSNSDYPPYKRRH